VVGTKDNVVDNITPVAIVTKGPCTSMMLIEQAGGSSTDYIIMAPTSGDAQVQFSAGGKRILRNATSKQGWPAGTTIGFIILVAAGTKHFMQAEDVE
jgi:hypothetical protein